MKSCCYFFHGVLCSKSKHIYKQIRIALLVLISGLAYFSSLAQEEYNPYATSFAATAIDGKLYLSWKTRAGFTCQDIHIEVSRDSVSGFERRGTYYGICGDSSERYYSYVLNNPILNARNYVKLELGNIGYSNTISVVVVKATQEIFVVPHPVESHSILHFKNKEKETFILKLYDAIGQIILTTKTNDEEISIGSYSLPQGFIYYDLYADRFQRYRGKLLVKH